MGVYIYQRALACGLTRRLALRFSNNLRVTGHVWIHPEPGAATLELILTPPIVTGNALACDRGPAERI